MNYSIILSIILIILWIIASLTWSELFWWIIVLFPVIILIRMRKRINIVYMILLIFWFMSFWIGLMSEWIISTWDIIVLSYLGLIFFIIWILIWIKKPIWANASPITVYGLFASIAAILWTIIISSNMPAPLPTAPTAGVVPKINTWSTSNTGFASTWSSTHNK